MPRFSRDCLSAHDQAVLDSIFNPFGIGEDIPGAFDVALSEEVQDPPEEQTPEVEESTRLDLSGVEAAEKGDISKALELFNKAIECAPNRAGPYNNRAQVSRLQGKDDEALLDLEKALDLSNSSGRTGCKALCQRGVLLRKRNNIEAAKEDFEKAAKLGSKFARTQLVEMNPYAALCNQMLSEAFKQLS